MPEPLAELTMACTSYRRQFAQPSNMQDKIGKVIGIISKDSVSVHFPDDSIDTYSTDALATLLPKRKILDHLNVNLAYLSAIQQKGAGNASFNCLFRYSH